MKPFTTLSNNHWLFIHLYDRWLHCSWYRATTVNFTSNVQWNEQGVDTISQLYLYIVWILKSSKGYKAKKSYYAITTGIITQYIHILCNYCLEIAKKNSTFFRSYLSFSVRPCQMAKMRIHRYSYHSCVQIMKFFHTITKWDDFGGTDKCATEKLFSFFSFDKIITLMFYSQVQRIEEQNQIFSLEIIQFDLLEVTIHYCRSFKCWRRLLYICR